MTIISSPTDTSYPLWRREENAAASVMWNMLNGSVVGARAVLERFVLDRDAYPTPDESEAGHRAIAEYLNEKLAS